MIAENSGKVYRFKLDHQLGFGFAEVYDFTDYSMFDGRIVYVFNRHDQDEKSNYELFEIRNTGIALGPIRLHKFPNVRGLHSWKYLFTANDFLINELPETKSLQGLEWKEDDWSNFDKWFKYGPNYDFKKDRVFVEYDEVRHLETTILNSRVGVVIKFTMKVILDNNEMVSDYYNLSELGNRNMFVQLVNTYYPLSKTQEYLKQLPVRTTQNGG